MNVTEARTGLSAAEAKAEEAEEALTHLRESASRGETVNPTKLGNAEATVQIAKLQIPPAQARLDEALEAEAEQRALNFATRIDTFLSRKAEIEDLLTAFHEAAEAYVKAAADHNTAVDALIRESKTEDPDERHTTRLRRRLGKASGVDQWSRPYGLETETGTLSAIPSPEDFSDFLYAGVLRTHLKRAPGTGTGRFTTRDDAIAKLRK